MLSELAGTNNRVVGTKQVLKALEGRMAKKVYLAEDIEPSLRAKITVAANTVECDVQSVTTMEELGKACGIQVGAATAAILK